jgi:hypothetical protein
VAAGFFHLLEYLNWRTANPGQDFDDLETQIIDRTKSTDRPNVAQIGLYTYTKSVAAHDLEKEGKRYERGEDEANDYGIRPASQTPLNNGIRSPGSGPGSFMSRGNESGRRTPSTSRV